MSIRAYLAAKAMQGHLAMHADNDTDGPTPEACAEWSVQYADALIAELNKEGK